VEESCNESRVEELGDDDLGRAALAGACRQGDCSMEEPLAVAGMGDVVRRAYEACAADESESQDLAALAQHGAVKGLHQVV